MSMATVLIQDMHAPERVAELTAETAVGVLAGWLTADGMNESTGNGTVRALCSALAREDWKRVHAYADALSVSVTVIETAEYAAAADALAASIWDAEL